MKLLLKIFAAFLAIIVVYFMFPTAIGGKFSLLNQDGKITTEQDFNGQFTLVFFGFTNCPDTCPTTLNTLSKTMELLKGDNRKVVPVFITVDPERDTPLVIKNYLSNFNPAIIGLTGSREEIRKIEDEYNIYSNKQEREAHNDYSFDHSAFIYLMDKQGKYLRHFTLDSTPKYIAESIESYADK